MSVAKRPKPKFRVGQVVADRDRDPVFGKIIQRRWDRIDRTWEYLVTSLRFFTEESGLRALTQREK